MKVYVEQHRDNTYRVMLKARGFKDTKTFDLPDTAAYLLLAAQGSTDALQDSLESMWHRNGDTWLRWDDDGGRGPGGGG